MMQNTSDRLFRALLFGPQPRSHQLVLVILLCSLLCPLWSSSGSCAPQPPLSHSTSTSRLSAALNAHTEEEHSRGGISQDLLPLRTTELARVAAAGEKLASASNGQADVSGATRRTRTRWPMRALLSVDERRDAISAGIEVADPLPAQRPTEEEGGEEEGGDTSLSWLLRRATETHRAAGRRSTTTGSLDRGRRDAGAGGAEAEGEQLTGEGATRVSRRTVDERRASLMSVDDNGTSLARLEARERRRLARLRAYISGEDRRDVSALVRESNARTDDESDTVDTMKREQKQKQDSEKEEKEVKEKEEGNRVRALIDERVRLTYSAQLVDHGLVPADLSVPLFSVNDEMRRARLPPSTTPLVDVFEIREVQPPRSNEVLYFSELPYDGLRIFIYPLPAEFGVSLTKHAGRLKNPDTNWAQFCHEIYFGEILAKSSVITRDPEEADLFFVPFPSFVDSYMNRALNRKVLAFFDWIRVQPYFKRYGGHDHFIVQGYPWDKFFWNTGKMNWIRIGVDTWFTMEAQHVMREKFVLIPYVDAATVSSPDPADILPEKSLFAVFAGSTEIPRQTIRYSLKRHFDEFASSSSRRGSRWEAHWINLNSRTNIKDKNFTAIYESSVFCPVPSGDTAQTKRLFDVIRAVCIPVIISDDILLPFRSFLNYDRFSIQIPSNKINLPNVKSIQDVDALGDAQVTQSFNLLHYLARIPWSQVQQMQKTLLQVRRHFVFHSDGVHPGDAMDMTLKELTQRAHLLRFWKKAAVANKWQAQQLSTSYSMDELSIKKLGG